MELKLKQPMQLRGMAGEIGVNVASIDSAMLERSITKVTSIETADDQSITFLSNPAYKKYLATTKAACVVLSAKDAVLCPAGVVPLVTDNPRLVLAKVLHLCHEQRQELPMIHATAVIDPSVKLGAGVHIGPYSVVGAGAELADGVRLEAGVVVGANCRLGVGAKLMPRVTLYERVTIGDGCTIHSGTVVGSDGFGYARDAAGWVKMLHLGGVVVGNNVEIGSNTTIDRGMLDDTVIGDNVIIDNLVQIAHNVSIGNCTAIAGCVGIAGSTSIGANCLIGGASCIGGHLHIVDNVIITATTAVNTSIDKAGIYSSGLPARENGEWRRGVARFMMLDSMAKRLREVEKLLSSVVEKE